jgi:hypothetical protein
VYTKHKRTQGLDQGLIPTRAQNEISNIPKSEKQPKNCTLLIPSILDVGYSTCACVCACVCVCVKCVRDYDLLQVTHKSKLNFKIFELAHTKTLGVHCDNSTRVYGIT